MKLLVQNIKTPYFSVEKFHLFAGERILIKGPSGSGKTTFLHLIAGLYWPNQGDIFWDEVNIRDLSDSELSYYRKTKIALVFQNLNLLSYLTAEENVELCGVSKETATKFLSKVHLQDKLKTRTQQLSLGEQQRIAIARVLAQEPELILADEPTSSLDDHNSQQVMSLLLNKSQKQSLIMVSHDHRIEHFFDKVVTAKDLLR
ncbi:MAG: ABC transporter ATP-binding protein [Pseudobdellovibrionaceae bacterium]